MQAFGWNTHLIESIPRTLRERIQFPISQSFVSRILIPTTSTWGNLRTGCPSR
jgi:hypothetical protein